jgi:hypothetical protein
MFLTLILLQVLQVSRYVLQPQLELQKPSN